MSYKVGIPKVSIIIPVYNVADKILKQSFFSIINQSYRDFECIVLDDSTDINLATFCKNICKLDNRFKYFHSQNRLGLANSLNFGISVSMGCYIARFDSDDICKPDRLAKQIAYLDNHPNIGVLGSAIEVIDANGVVLSLRTYPESHKDIAICFQYTTPLAHPTVIFRSSIVQELGAYSKDFLYSEDLDLWLRLLKNGIIFANLNDALVQYRQTTFIRKSDHWKYNLKARIKNFSTVYFVHRVLGLICVLVWSVMPKMLQVVLYKKIFHKH